MKKITLLVFLMMVSVGYAQVPETIEDFETTLPAEAFFLNNGMVSANQVPDPATGGTNGTVLELVTGAAGQPWQQAELFLQGDWIDLTINKTVQIDVYSDTAFDLLAKVVEPGTTGPESATDASYTTPGEWQTLTFNFAVPKDGTGVANDVYGTIFFLPLWDSSANGGAGGWCAGCGQNNALDTTSYVDNIFAASAPPPETCSDGIMNNEETGVDCGGPNCVACPTPPTTPAPTPPARNPQDVGSFYSNAYDLDVIYSSFSAGWCGNPAIADEVVMGDDVIHYLGLPCQGIQFESDRQDLSAFNKFHVDFYTDQTDLVGKVFNLKFVDFGGGAGEASSLQININDGTSPGIQTGVWVSVDIDISAVGGLVAGSVTRSDIAQIGITSNLANVWYDNIYFYSDTVINSDCANAIPLVLGEDPVSIGNLGATDSGVNASCDTGIISDVWYSFEGTATGEAYFDTTAPNLSVWTSCTGGTELACNPGSSAVTGLTMGTTYYIRVNDDGSARAPGIFTIQVSDTTLGTDDFAAGEFKVYPNPTNNEWIVRTNGQDITAVQVFDILGKNVMSVTPNSDSVKLDATTLPAGLYFAKISSESGTKSVKLIKQ